MYRPKFEGKSVLFASHGSGALVVRTGLCYPRFAPRLFAAIGAKEATGFWLTELLLLACIAGAAGDSWIQEANYYLPGTVIPLSGRRSLRRYHTVVVDSDNYVGRLT